MRTSVSMAAIVLSAVALGCGEDAVQSSDGSGRMVVEVGAPPIHVVAPLYIGIEQGFFEQQGLEVRPRVQQSGAEVVTAVVSGELQFGYADLVPQIAAFAKGLPIRAVAPLPAIPDDSDDHCICVKKSGDIRDLSDLEGRTIAVVALQDIEVVTIKASLEQAGVDVSTVDFVEIPFPDMPVALATGRVDAALLVDPFLALSRSDVRILNRPFVDSIPDLTVAGYFGSAEFTDENQDVTARFVRGLEQASRYADQHPDEVRRVVTTYTEIPPPVVQQIYLPEFSGPFNPQSLQTLAELMRRYGIIEEVPDLEPLLPAAAGG